MFIFIASHERQDMGPLYSSLFREEGEYRCCITARSIWLNSEFNYENGTFCYKCHFL